MDSLKLSEISMNIDSQTSLGNILPDGGDTNTNST